MAADKLKYAIGNAASTTLSTSMTNTDTTTPLTSSTNFDDAPTSGAGMILIDEGQAAEEIAYSTGIGGASLTTPLANRGLEGGSAQAHDAGASVKGVLTIGMWNDVIDSLKNLVLATTGAVDTTKIVDVATAQTISGAKTFSAAPLLTFGTEANGDIFYGNGSGQLQRLPVGSNGTVLTLAAGVPSWASGGSSDGWTTDSGSTWTYASATTINVADGTKFVKGTRIKLTQTTAKYFVVTGISGNVITVTGGTDYTVANAAITTQQYSHEASPLGYPGSFTYTPTVTSEGGTFTTTVPAGKFRVIGNTCWLSLKIGVTTVGTATGGMDITVPITADTTNYYAFTGFNNGVGTALAGEVSTTSLVRIKKYDNTQPATTGGQVAVHGMYNF